MKRELRVRFAKPEATDENGETNQKDFEIEGAVAHICHALVRGAQLAVIGAISYVAMDTVRQVVVANNTPPANRK